MLLQLFAVRRSIYRLSLLAGLCCSGCALLKIDGVVSQHAFKPPVNPALEVYLDQEVWRANPAWSVVELRRDRNRAPLTTRRWIFGSKDLDHQLEQISLGLNEDGGSDRNATPSFEATSAVVRSSTAARDLNRELALIAHRRDRIGWNAAIMWARRDPWAARSVAPLLESLVSDPSQAIDSPDESAEATSPVNPNRSLRATMEKIWDARSTFDKRAQPASMTKISAEMRAAAAEAWCLVLAADEKGSDSEQRLAPAGRLLIENKLPTVVRAELFRGLASVIAPDRIPGLSEAIEVGPPAGKEVRRGAIDACMIYAHANRDWTDRKPSVRRYDPSSWPPSIENCRQDADKHVRAAFGRWSAVAGHPDALDWIKSQLRDSDLGVRQAALASLGYVATEAARDELREQSKRPEELVRVFAMRGLASWGVRELVLATDDSSSIVRQTVAQMLAQFPGVEGSLLIEKLLDDANPQVQAAALDAIDSWPNELAIRLMLHGLQHCSLRNRQKCFVQLQGRIPDIETFPIDGLHEERVAAANALAAEFDAVGGYLDQVQRAGLATIPRTDESRESEVRGWLGDVMRTPPGSPIHTAAKDQLLRLGPADVSLIEKFLLEQRVASHHFLFYELLPRLSPKYAALVQLENSDVFVRRKGAATLAQTGEGASLSLLIARRLHDLLAQEQDEPVWRSVASAFLHGRQRRERPTGFVGD